ncbi:MAG TPA: FGGY family carbohydrate kinase [Streptosporangiaceae bacterium]
MTVLLAIDQGSSSSRCVVLDPRLRVLAQAGRPLRSQFPASGWVEHDPREITASVTGAVAGALEQAGASWPDVAAIGLAAQTETFVVWDAASGEPVYPAVSWRDTRAGALCGRLRAEGYEELVRERTGLPLEAAFSAPKLRWVLDQVPGAQAAAEAGRLRFGDVNCWLTWCLSGGARHVTEPSMAARTMLFGAASLAWDQELLDLFGVPAAMLPEVVPTAGELAVTDAAVAGGRALIRASLGDQQAALFGQRCWSAGMAKLTLGTGAFLWCHAGPVPPAAVPPGVVASTAWQTSDAHAYCFEGFVPNAGGVVTWLRGLGAVPAGRWPEIRDGAGRGGDGDPAAGLWCVPALFGLGTPHWGTAARADVVGLGPGSTGADLAEAALLGVVHQVADAIDAVRGGLAGPLEVIRVDGGMARNDSVLRAVADLAGVTLERTGVTEATALGAGALAGLGAGLWDQAGLAALPFDAGQRISPALGEAGRAAARAGWRGALDAALARWPVAGG